MGDIFDTSHVIVAKVGSSTLISSDGGVDEAFVGSLADQMAQLAREGYHPILVTSGAVAAGFRHLGLQARPDDIPTLQACASAGQAALTEVYAEAFRRHGIAVGQVLLSRRDLADRQTYLNASNTLGRLLAFGAVPVVNENDTVSVAEFTFGDNDTLGAIVATIVNASLYVILSDVDGLYKTNPDLDPAAQLVDTLDAITPEVEAMAGDAGSAVGTGGMRTKLRAGRITLAAKIPMVICKGRQEDTLVRATHGERVGTRIEAAPAAHHEGARKLWLATAELPQGSIVLDGGAVHAVLHEGASVLPVGIREVKGDFSKQSVVDVQSLDGTLIGRGVVRYPADELRRYRGLRLDVIGRFVSDKAGQPAIHRDDLLVF